MGNALHVIAFAICLQSGLATESAAGLLHYNLDAEGSVVGFEVDFGQNIIRGQMPVAQAELTLDFDHVAASAITVTLRADNARASFPFAAEAMRGENVLATRRYPEITFVSTAVSATPTGATVTGDITIRDITRPVSLDARLYRAAGTTAGERDNLTILLSGTVSRAAFGANGFADMVGDEVRLKIRAHIRLDR